MGLSVSALTDETEGARLLSESVDAQAKIEGEKILQRTKSAIDLEVERKQAHRPALIVTPPTLH